MGHNHSHSGSDGNRKNILIAFFLNASFAIIELIGGFYTNSIAIMSDALHDFGDSLALLFSYFAEKLSDKDPDKKYTFGYRRFSILAALVNGGILLAGSVFVIFEAIGRIQSPEEVKAEGMVWLAILGISVNSYAAWRLSKNSGVNMKMIMLHLLEDLFGWVAVLIVSIILLFKPWFVLDAVLSILISAIILRGVYKNLKKVFMILLQHFPSELEIGEIKNKIEEFSGVENIHEIKGWSLDDEHHYLRFHVKVSPEMEMKSVDKIKIEIKNLLQTYNVTYSSIEFESSGCE